MRNTDSNTAISQYFKDNYQIFTYFGIYSGNGYGSIFNWGNEMGLYLNQFKNEYKTIYGGIFDYQRVGDVGRGWFSQNKDKRKGV